MHRWECSDEWVKDFRLDIETNETRKVLYALSLLSMRSDEVKVQQRS